MSNPQGSDNRADAIWRGVAATSSPAYDAARAQRKADIIRLYDETNKGNFEIMYELLAKNFVSYGGAGFQDLHGVDAFVGLYKTFVTAFPDLHFDVLHIVVDDDIAAVRGLQTGTHLGNFLGMVPATGIKVAWTGTAIFKYDADGRIAERWQDLDNLSLFQQLGVLPKFQSAGG
jgi:steroid delta-isomerase-like uncharacterized protein